MLKAAHHFFFKTDRDPLFDPGTFSGSTSTPTSPVSRRRRTGQKSRRWRCEVGKASGRWEGHPACVQSNCYVKIDYLITEKWEIMAITMNLCWQMGRKTTKENSISMVLAISSVLFTYNEDTNVIITVTGSTSQMRCPEYFFETKSCFLGTGQWV